jgi:hypothetical protein
VFISGPKQMPLFFAQFVIGFVYWEFESYSSFFVQFFPNHIFSSRTTLKDNSESLGDLVEGLLSAIDKSIEPISA